MAPSLLPDIAVTMPSVPQPLSSWPEHLQASWLRCAHQTSASLWHPPHCARGQTLESLRQRKRDLLTTGEMAALVEAAQGLPKEAEVLFVTNEVGAGIVPENRLARLYRDLAGLANQQLAAAADAVYAVLCGIPLRIK